MALRIPLGLAPAGAGAPSAASGVRIPIGLNLGNIVVGGNREQRLTRAMIGAVALADPAAALTQVTRGRKNPEKVVFSNRDKERVHEVLAVIARSVPGTVPAAKDDLDTAQIEAVAKAVGTDSAAVATGVNELPAVDRDPYLAWAASLDLDLLEAAAHAALRARCLAAIPDPSGRLEDVEEEVKRLRAQVDTILRDKPD